MPGSLPDKSGVVHVGQMSRKLGLSTHKTW